MSSFDSVAEFEAQVAKFAGAKYSVAMASCTDALHLSLEYLDVRGKTVEIPARTYISVPFAVIHAGGNVRFTNNEWYGTYCLEPFPVIDGAKRMRKGMYNGGLHCLSFHMKKLLPIGRGGMVLTDDPGIARWLRCARLDGRNGGLSLMQDSVTQIGWNCYMTPEQASRGLHLLEGLKPDLPDLYDEYPDLRKMPVFQNKPYVVG